MSAFKPFSNYCTRAEGGGGPNVQTCTITGPEIQKTNTLVEETTLVNGSLATLDIAFTPEFKITAAQFEKMYHILKYFIIIGGTFEMIAPAFGGKTEIAIIVLKKIFMIISALVSTTMKVSYAAALTGIDVTSSVSTNAASTAASTIFSTISSCFNGGASLVSSITSLLVGVTTYITYDNAATAVDFIGNQAERTVFTAAENLANGLVDPIKFPKLMQSGANLVNAFISNTTALLDASIDTLTSERVWQMLNDARYNDAVVLKDTATKYPQYIRGVTEGVGASAVTCELIDTSIAGQRGWDIYLLMMRRNGFSLSDCMATAAGRFLFEMRNRPMPTHTESLPETYSNKDTSATPTSISSYDINSLPSPIVFKSTSEAQVNALAREFLAIFNQRQADNIAAVKAKVKERELLRKGDITLTATEAATNIEECSFQIENKPSTFDKKRALEIFYAESELLQAQADIIACETDRCDEEKYLQSQLCKKAKRPPTELGGTTRHKKRRPTNRKTRKGRKTKRHRKRRAYKQSKRRY